MVTPRKFVHSGGLTLIAGLVLFNFIVSSWRHRQREWRRVSAGGGAGTDKPPLKALDQKRRRFELYYFHPVALAEMPSALWVV